MRLTTNYNEQRGCKIQGRCKTNQRKNVPLNSRVYDSEQWRRPQPSSFYPPRPCPLLAANYFLQTVRDKNPLRRPNIVRDTRGLLIRNPPSLPTAKLLHQLEPTHVAWWCRQFLTMMRLACTSKGQRGNFVLSQHLLRERGGRVEGMYSNPGL